MRAIVVKEPGPPESMRLRDVPVPHPREAEVTIDVAFAGVGFVDTLFRSGAFHLEPPFTPGIGVAGRVREVGSGVEGFRFRA